MRAITIAWYTGIRPGAVELLQLKWSDVDWERRCLFVIGARKGGPVRRVVPLDLEGGANLKIVSAMAGHSRTDTTTRIYQHINMDLMRASIAKMPVIGSTGKTKTKVGGRN